MKAIFQSELNSLIDLIGQIDLEQLAAAAELIRATPGQLLILGNGGPNGFANPMAQDLSLITN